MTHNRKETEKQKTGVSFTNSTSGKTTFELSAFADVVLLKT